MSTTTYSTHRSQIAHVLSDTRLRNRRDQMLEHLTGRRRNRTMLAHYLKGLRLLKKLFAVGANGRYTFRTKKFDGDWREISRQEIVELTEFSAWQVRMFLQEFERFGFIERWCQRNLLDGWKSVLRIKLCPDKIAQALDASSVAQQGDTDVEVAAKNREDETEIASSSLCDNSLAFSSHYTASPSPVDGFVDEKKVESSPSEVNSMDSGCSGIGAEVPLNKKKTRPAGVAGNAFDFGKKKTIKLTNQPGRPLTTVAVNAEVAAIIETLRAFHLFRDADWTARNVRQIVRWNRDTRMQKHMSLDAVQAWISDWEMDVKTPETAWTLTVDLNFFTAAWPAIHSARERAKHGARVGRLPFLREILADYRQDAADFLACMRREVIDRSAACSYRKAVQLVSWTPGDCRRSMLPFLFEHYMQQDLLPECVDTAKQFLTLGDEDPMLMQGCIELGLPVMDWVKRAAHILQVPVPRWNLLKDIAEIRESIVAAEACVDLWKIDFEKI